MSFLSRIREKAKVETRVFIDPEFLSEEECAALVTDLDATQFFPATLVRKRKELDENIRKADNTVIQRKDIEARIRAKLVEWFGVEPRTEKTLTALRYERGGHYIGHCDGVSVFREEGGGIVSMRDESLDRDLSIVLYLNEEFTGGEFVFDHSGQTVQPTRGMLLAFPSDWRHRHQVKEITDGVRYAIVSWYRTDPTIIPSKESVPDIQGSRFY